MNRTVILVSTPIKPDLVAAIAAQQAPRRDYFELQRLLDATLLVAPAPPSRRYRTLQRVGGAGLAMAAHAWARRGEYDTILTDHEGVGLPLALLFKLTGTRRHHVMISHYLTPRRKQFFFRTLRVQTHIARTICYSTAQAALARGPLGLGLGEVSLVLHPADSAFWRPATSDAERDQDTQLLHAAGLTLPPHAVVIASAGLEFRDYPTLLAAVPQLSSTTRVVIAAASPWSKRKDTAGGRDLPPNVQRVALTPLQLRALYRRAQLVAIPLYDVDFQAGSLVAYEALACGRPVVISHTRGQNDIVRADETGCYVPPGDSAALATALTTLLADPARCARMGAAARADVEAGLNLDTYLAQMVQFVTEVGARRIAHGSGGGTALVAAPGTANEQGGIG